jgi:hypothetical protein
MSSRENYVQVMLMQILMEKLDGWMQVREVLS